MKKVLNITIAETLFSIEEDAYQKLRDYLDSIEAYFSSDSDSKEIIKDIEARIAEQLLDAKKEKGGVIASEDVSSLISVMGRVEDFAEKGGDEFKEKENCAPRELMRDPDDVVIAGVASGMAAYFGADPLLMRIIFIAGSFMLGLAGGVIIYIVLFLVMPEARTPADKIKMRGGPIRLHSFKKTVLERGEKVKEDGRKAFNASWPKAKEFANRLLYASGKVARFLGKIFLSLFGIILGIISAAVFSVATFIAANLLIKPEAKFADIPIYGILPDYIYYALSFVAYLAIIIPVIFIGSIALTFIRKKKTLNLRSSLGFFAVWIFSLALGSAIVIRYLPEFQSRAAELPEYQVESRVLPLQGFTKLEFHGLGNARISEGPEYAVAVEGRRAELDRLKFYVEDETLLYREDPAFQVCFLCKNAGINISVTMPSLKEITASGAVRVEARPIVSDEISIYLSGLSRAVIPLTAKKAAIFAGGTSSLVLTGKADELGIKMDGLAKFDGGSFPVKSAKISASGGTSAVLSVSESLSVDGSGISKITYRGSPSLDVKTSGQAEVIKEGR